MIPTTDIWLSFLGFIASIMNGAIGYGFSSIITPIAVLFVSNKILNPALVLLIFQVLRLKSGKNMSPL